MIHIYDKFWFFIKWSGTSFPTTYCVCYLKKNITYVLFYYSILLLLMFYSLRLEILGKMFNEIVSFPVCELIYLEINFSFNILKVKMKWKAFWSVLKAFQTFLELESAIYVKVFLLVCSLFIISYVYHVMNKYR